MTTPQRGFVSLQALRGLAALGVVLFHLLPFEAKYLPGPAIVPSGFAAGRDGVDVFFVLSGFVVAWTTRRNGGLADARGFLLRRLARIYPPYWIVCALLLIAAAAHLLPPHPSAPDIAASVLLLPSAQPPLLLVSWTLVFEVYFYLAFTIILLASIRRRLPLLGLWCAAAFLLRLLAPRGSAGPAVDVLGSPLMLEFAAGCLAASLLAAGHGRRWADMLMLVGAASATLAIARQDAFAAEPYLRILLVGGGIASLLLGAATRDAWFRNRLPRALPWLGDISYALYLTHLLTIAVIGRALTMLAAPTHPIGHAAALAGAVLASIIVAHVFHVAVERPLLRMTQSLLRPSVAATATLPA